MTSEEYLDIFISELVEIINNPPSTSIILDSVAVYLPLLHCTSCLVRCGDTETLLEIWVLNHRKNNKNISIKNAMLTLRKCSGFITPCCIRTIFANQFNNVDASSHFIKSIECSSALLIQNNIKIYQLRSDENPIENETKGNIKILKGRIDISNLYNTFCL